MALKYYAVKSGKSTGIFTSWEKCKEQVHGYAGAIYKSFKTRDEAENYMSGESSRPYEDMPEDEQDYIDYCAANKAAVAYVDGSYNIATEEFSCGVVMFTADGIQRISEKADISIPHEKELAAMRNVAGEIKGSMWAMTYCMENGITQLTIHYDYEGIARWCTGEWKTNKAGTIEYRRFYDTVKQGVNVKFVKVKGHSGVKFNEEADLLAKAALGIKTGEKD